MMIQRNTIYTLKKKYYESCWPRDVLVDENLIDDPPIKTPWVHTKILSVGLDIYKDKLNACIEISYKEFFLKFEKKHALKSKYEI